MGRRTMAWMLAFALVLSMLPLRVLAVEQIHSGDAHKCEHCQATVTWEAWGDTDQEKKTLPKGTAGKTTHYYLVSDVTVTGRTEMTDKSHVVICLNGHTVDGGAKDTIYRLGGTATLTIGDCTAYTDDLGEYHAGTIRNGKNTGGVGGAFYVYGDAQLTMHGGIVAENHNTTTDVKESNDGYSGGAIHARGNGRVVLNNVLLRDNTSTREGGAICIRGGTATLVATGCTFRGNRAGMENAVSTGGGAIYSKSSPVILKDCVFLDNQTAKTGGAISLMGDGATLTAEGCRFAENRADLGGAIYARNAQITMTGCELEKNIMTGGGSGVLYCNNTTATLQDCRLADNTTSGYGASAIYMTVGSRVTLEDCAITGNTVSGTETKTRAAIYLTKAEDQLILKGKTQFTGNLVATDGQQLERGIYLQAATTVDVGGLTDGARVLISNGTGWTPTEASQLVSAEAAPGAWKRTWVLHENSGQAVDYSREKGFYFALNTEHIHCPCGDGDCTDEAVEYLPWESTTSLPTGGNYYLTADVTMSAGVSVTKDLNLCLNGYKVTAAAKSRHFSTPKDAAVEIAISDCTAAGAEDAYTAGGFYGGVDQGSGQGGGAIYIRSGGRLKIYDGIFANNTSITGGGAIRMAANTSLTIYNGKFTGNTAVSADGKSWRYGGAVSATSDTDMTILGGVFQNNKGSQGSAVYAGGKTLAIAGGLFTGNIATVSGAIFTAENTAITLEGAPRILDNEKGNLYLADRLPITLGQLTQKANVGITGTAGAFTTACPDHSACFTADSPYLKVAYVDGALHLVAGGEHKHCLCGGQGLGCDHSNLAWMAWESTDTLPASGCYYLLNDVVLTGEVTVSKDLNLCLNGHKITAAKDKRIFSTASGAKVTLTISDCGEAGLITGGADLSDTQGGGAIYVRAGSSLALYGGTICGNTAKIGGGAILLLGSRFAMYGGTICHNAAIKAENSYNNGGAIYAGKDSQVELLGGCIENNRAYSGGAVYLTGGQLTVKGGTIRENIAQQNGGGIYGTKSQVQISGGQILDNSSQKDGAGVYFREGNMDISGDVRIAGNASVTTGGGVCYSGKATGIISGGMIEKNSCSGGCGMIVQGGSSVEITGGIIRDHKANSYGGAVYVHNSQLKITGGTMTGNTAKYAGGALYVNQKDAKLLLAGGEILKNSAKNGGAIMLENGAVMEMSAGKLSGNTTQGGSGGAVYARANTTFKMTGGTIAGNTVTGAGGGIYGLRANLTLSGGSVSGNRANGAGGGGIYLNGATASFSGTSITGNSTKGNGGGVGSTRNVVKTNGVETASYPTTIRISGSYIANNTGKNGGGVIMNGIGGKLEMHSGSIVHNTATNYGGGLYVSTQCAVNMTGGSVSNNSSPKSGGGIYAGRCQGKITGTTFADNTAKGTGGGLYLAAGALVDFEKVTFAQNRSGKMGGGIYAASNEKYWVENEFVDCTFRGNVAATYGGGYYSSFGVELDMIGCTFQDNVAEGTDSATGNGGAVAVRDIARIRDCTFTGNKAQLGGAFYGGNMQLTYSANGWGTKGAQVGVVIQNSTFTDNNASEKGGAIFNGMSSFATLEQLTITDNSAAQGSGIYAEDDMTLLDVTVSGNVAPEGGHAVFLADSEYDGQTYIRGLFKLHGDIIIRDNQGGGLYFDNLVTAIVTGEGLMPKTYMEVSLDKGVLTNRLIGAYDYQGGDRVYTVTYGDRSLTQPEIDPELRQMKHEQVQTEADEEKDTLLYVIIGVIGLAVIAGAALLIGKKKKSGEKK